jgi:hypothetical protein
MTLAPGYRNVKLTPFKQEKKKKKMLHVFVDHHTCWLAVLREAQIKLKNY